jgi:hypothetical protein
MKLILQHLAEASARRHLQEKNALSSAAAPEPDPETAAPVLSDGMKRRMSVGGEAPDASKNRSIEQQILLSNPITEVRVYMGSTKRQQSFVVRLSKQAFFIVVVAVSFRFRPLAMLKPRVTTTRLVLGNGQRCSSPKRCGSFKYFCFTQ